MKTCSKCGENNTDDAEYCTKCGTPLPENIKYCPYCGSKLEPGVLKCKHCGEWVQNNPNKTYISDALNNQDPKILTLIGLAATVIGFIITMQMENTPYIALSGILTINFIWVFLTLILGLYLLIKLGNTTIELIGKNKVNIYAIIILIINIWFLISCINAFMWNPFG
ncbi:MULTISPECIES: zinc-ribbon domain-containing protein [unclassified Methanobrevibacter]|jgi:ribosomal protein L40E|uniref:zinc-ribbon domain-containing protein n=1 Tax=unclassified Methanobrevibacter TaxID=2638681 RepID=UPI0039B82BF3